MKDPFGLKFKKFNQITSKEFEVTIGNSDKRKSIKYQWSDVVSTSLNEEELLLTFNFKDGKTLQVLNEACYDWFDLIFALPESIVNQSTPSISEFLKTLQPCKICGFKAVVNETCHCCCNNVWDKSVHDSFETEKKLILKTNS